MQYTDAVRVVAEAATKAMNEIVKKSYFVLLFVDKDGEIHGYDTRNVASCLDQVLDRNPTFEFVHVVAESTEASVRALCAQIRSVRDMRLKIKVLISESSKVPAAAAS